MLFVYVALVGFILLGRRSKLYIPALSAALIALVWTAAAGDIYMYNTENLVPFGVNLFPLFAWSAGLLSGYFLYLAALKLVKVKKSWQKLVLFNILYVPILITLETVAYHAFGVVNEATSSYAGLAFCDCMHAPGWMQVVYFLMGTFYMLTIWAVRKLYGLGYLDLKRYI